jgi:hypothetical protein
MNIVRKTIRGHEYVYVSERVGSKVVHRYLGPSRSVRVERIVAEKKEASGVPDTLRFLFWDTNPQEIRLRRHATYVIERVLEFGDLDAIRWLQRVYTVQKIVDVLEVSRLITPKSSRFWKLWFDTSDA